MTAGKSTEPILVDLDRLEEDAEGFVRVGELDLEAKVEQDGFDRQVSIEASTQLDLPHRENLDGEEVLVKKKDLRRLWIDDLPNSVFGKPSFDMVSTEKGLHLEVGWQAPRSNLTDAPLDLSAVRESEIAMKNWFQDQVRTQVGSGASKVNSILAHSINTPLQVLATSRLTGSVSEGFGRGDDGELNISLQDSLTAVIIPIFTTEDIPLDIEGTQFERLQEEFERSNERNESLIDDLFSPMVVTARFSSKSDYLLGGRRQPIAETSATVPASSVIELVEINPRRDDNQVESEMKEVDPV